MNSFIDMLLNDTFITYLNSIDKWIITQEYNALNSLYESWASDETIKQFLIENVLDSNYQNLFVGKFFLSDKNKSITDTLSKKKVGDIQTRSNASLHNWTKDKSVAEDFSKVHYAFQPQTAYSHGFVAQIKGTPQKKDIVCDNNRLIVYIRKQLRNPEVIKIANEKKANLILDIMSGNDVMEQEYEVLVDGAFNQAQIVSTWERYSNGGKMSVDKKGQW